VQELQDVVNLQAGVVDGHFRGGRQNEVQYQVDGVSVNNAFDNSNSVRLDRSLLEEVQVVSGTFDAEYGQAMSGVVNAVLRRGSDVLEWDGEALAGGSCTPVTPEARPRTSARRPAGLPVHDLRSGPAPPATFLANVSHHALDDASTACGASLPTPGPAAVPPTSSCPRRRRRARSAPPLARVVGIFKLSNRVFEGKELSYQVLVNTVDARNARGRCI